MSYQLYVTGGYGFTESILPSVLHPSNAVDIAQDYFTRGYQGQHIDLPQDAGVPPGGKLTSRQKQTLLDDLHEGRLVLSSRHEPGFALFTEPKANPDVLRNDLPPALRQHLQKQWPGKSGGGASAFRPDSLASASEPLRYSPEPSVTAKPVPGAGAYQLSLAYLWPDGTGLAGLPFTVGTDNDAVTGTLDHNGEALLKGLNDRFAVVRLSSDASDDDVGHQRRGIQAALKELLKREQTEADALARTYQALPWYQRSLVSTGAVLQGVTDAGIGLLRFVDSMADLASPTQALMDGLKSAWSASEDSSDTQWYESFQNTYDEARHQRWVKALGFNPSDITRADVAQAYELANLVMADPILKDSLTDFAAEYAQIQHHTEVSYFAGAVVFDLILAALLAAATGGVGAAGAAAGQIRHTGLLAHLGKTVQNYGAAVHKQRLRRLWRNTDLKTQNHLEATTSKRVKGLDLKPANPAAAIAAKQLLVKTFEEAKAALGKSREKIIASGEPPPPKYTQAELAHIAKTGVADEKYVVRLVEEPHINRGGAMSGTLGASGPTGVRVWSTTFDQMEHLDTDPRLITQQMGVDYDPKKSYKLAIIDQAEAVKQAGAQTMVPTYDNLSRFIQDKLPGKVQNPALAKEVMTPEYSRQYEALVRDMPDSAWKNSRDRENYMVGKGLDPNDMDLFETRLSIQKNVGANSHFTGNGLTKITNSTGDKPIYGAVETFSLHKNPKTFRQMTGMEGGSQWAELVDLKPIELGN
jgi:hypothetical protein